MGSSRNNIEAYQKSVTPDYNIETQIVSYITPLQHPYMQDTYRRFYQTASHHIIQVVDLEQQVKYEIKRTLDYKQVLIQIVEALSKKPAELEYIFLSMVFLDIATLEGFVPLHASCVIKNSEAYLFSAPSGVGKSTHAQFYQTELKGFVINDDKPIIKDFKVYGTPFSGKTSLNQNTSYPLKAIYFIEQGSLYQINRLSMGEASKKLLKNIASDLHNLRAAIVSTNSSRSNKWYDTSTTTSTYYPGDDKGDVARILFYMVVTYKLGFSQYHNSSNG